MRPNCPTCGSHIAVCGNCRKLLSLHGPGIRTVSGVYCNQSCINSDRAADSAADLVAMAALRATSSAKDGELEELVTEVQKEAQKEAFTKDHGTSEEVHEHYTKTVEDY